MPRTFEFSGKIICMSDGANSCEIMFSKNFKKGKDIGFLNIAL